MNVFVVTRLYDWDDEYGYQQFEHIKVFTSVEKTQEFCDTKNDEEFLNMENSRRKACFIWEEVEFEQ